MSSDNDKKEDKTTHRHEVYLTPAEWEEYQKACEHPDVMRKPKQQTEYMIRQFLKRMAKPK
jgi:hypothetical protein